MIIGVVFPPALATAPNIRAWTADIEGGGARYVSVSDHILTIDPSVQSAGWDRAWPHDSEHATSHAFGTPFHEPMVLLGFLAGLTQMDLATGIVVLPQRGTALFAKQAAEVDVLSGGRLRVGVGVGWNVAEYESLGADFSTRGRRLEEQMVLLRQLWSQESVEFRGAGHLLQGAGLSPLPVQRPIPLWLGGASLRRGMAPVMRLLDRIGRSADGWCMDSAASPTVATTAIAHVRSAAEAAGRDSAKLGFEVRCRLGPHQLGRLPELMHDWVRAGATHLCLDVRRPSGYPEQAHHALLAALEQARATTD